MLPFFLLLLNRSVLLLWPSVTMSSEEVLAFAHFWVWKLMPHILGFCYINILIQAPNSVLFCLLLHNKPPQNIIKPFHFAEGFWSRFTRQRVSDLFVASAVVFRARESTYQMASPLTYLLLGLFLSMYTRCLIFQDHSMWLKLLRAWWSQGS